MNDLHLLLVLSSLAGVYLILDLPTILFVYLFARERFYSWLRDEYVKTDESYHIKYNRHGMPVSMRINTNNVKVRKQLGGKL